MVKSYYISLYLVWWRLAATSFIINFVAFFFFLLPQLFTSKHSSSLYAYNVLSSVICGTIKHVKLSNKASHCPEVFFTLSLLPVICYYRNKLCLFLLYFLLLWNIPTWKCLHSMMSFSSVGESYKKILSLEHLCLVNLLNMFFFSVYSIGIPDIFFAPILQRLYSSRSAYFPRLYACYNI